MLADWEILNARRAGGLVIEPFKEDSLQPVSVDIHLGPIIKTEVYMEQLDSGEPGWVEWNLDRMGPQWIPSGKFLLASTVEYFELPSCYAAEVRDKSSLARQGLFMSHGLIDPGFKGHITLEFVNHSRRSVLFTSGMSIGQITFYAVEEVVRPYGHAEISSHYQNQESTPQIARA